MYNPSRAISFGKRREHIWRAFLKLPRMVWKNWSDFTAGWCMRNQFFALPQWKKTLWGTQEKVKNRCGVVWKANVRHPYYVSKVVLTDKNAASIQWLISVIFICHFRYVNYDFHHGRKIGRRNEAFEKDQIEKTSLSGPEITAHTSRPETGRSLRSTEFGNPISRMSEATLPFCDTKDRPNSQASSMLTDKKQPLDFSWNVRQSHIGQGISISIQSSLTINTISYNGTSVFSQGSRLVFQTVVFQLIFCHSKHVFQRKLK